MAQDIFGYNKEEGGAAASPQFVTISVGGKINLAQAVQLSYGRQVIPVYEIGSATVRMQPGPSSGTCSITHAVGDGVGNFGGINEQAGPCDTQSISISGNGGCGSLSGGVTATGMLTRVGMSIQAGNAIVTDTAEFTLSNLSMG